MNPLCIYTKAFNLDSGVCTQFILEAGTYSPPVNVSCCNSYYTHTLGDTTDISLLYSCNQNLMSTDTS